jgi:hypothetical protein
MVSERDTCIGVSTAGHTHSFRHNMADNPTIAVYHHNIGTFDFGSGFSVFPMAGF